MWVLYVSMLFMFELGFKLKKFITNLIFFLNAYTIKYEIRESVIPCVPFLTIPKQQSTVAT